MRNKSRDAVPASAACPRGARLWGVGLLAAAAFLGGCSKPPPAEEPVRAVKLLTVGESAYGSGYEYAADVRPRVEARLGFRVAGKITRRAVELGQRVQAGQLLAQVDATDYQLAADAARAQVSSATTQRDLAAADLKRFQGLRDQGFISAAEIERRTAQLKAAPATPDQSRAQLSSQRQVPGTAPRMNVSRLFIQRPVATGLFMLAIVLSGLLGLRFLPLAALPQVDYPTIQVQTLYPGASPDVMSRTVTAPLERQFGQMSGLDRMSSTSAAGALVTKNMQVPPGSLVMGSPAKVVRALTPEEQAANTSLAHKYVEVSRRFLAQDVPGLMASNQ